MPLQIRRLAAALSLVLLAGGARAAAEPCAMNIDNIAREATKIGIDMSRKLEPVQRGIEEPKFAKIAQALEMEGDVVVLMVIGRNGAVADQVVLCAEPFGYFEPAVLSWSKDFRFEPLAADAKPHYRGHILTVKFRFRRR